MRLGYLHAAHAVQRVRNTGLSKVTLCFHAFAHFLEPSFLWFQSNRECGLAWFSFVQAAGRVNMGVKVLV